jgi:uncharacterized protein with PIN domain
MDKSNLRRETAEQKKKRTEEFWRKLAWELTSCDEAAEVFPEMTVCPVCNAMLSKVELTDNFVMVHKSREDIIN